MLAAGGLVGMGVSSASASPRGPWLQVVDVTGNGASVQLSQNSVGAGPVQFRVSSTLSSASGESSEITMFRPKHGASLATVLSDFQEEFAPDPSTDAKGTRDLTRDAEFVGLADVSQEDPMLVTESLDPGQYYVFDAGKTPPTGPGSLTPFTVTPSHRDHHGRDDGDGDRDHGDHRDGPHSAFTVKLTSADTFSAPRHWPHRGTVTVANVSDTLHFMNLVPVQAGTTDQQVQQYFDTSMGSNQPPSFIDPSRPSGGADVQSPGRSLQLTYDLPAGTYVLLCFVADDQTGMPHAAMGMHKVVVLH